VFLSFFFHVPLRAISPTLNIPSIFTRNLADQCLHLPKLITPMAWNTSLLIKFKGSIGAPLISAGILGPSIKTVMMITKMAESAKALVLASLEISRYMDSGQDTVTVKNVMQRRRLENIHRMGILSMVGTKDLITWGMVSPA